MDRDVRIAAGLTVLTGLAVFTALTAGAADSDSPAPSQGRATASDVPWALREPYVKNLGDEAVRRLKTNFERFESLDPADREQLRQLHRDLQAEPDSERLTEVMLRYHDWLRRLTPGERAMLKSLPVEQRVGAIQRILERQERDRFLELARNSLTPADQEAILDWMTQLAYDQLPAADRERLDRIENARIRGGATMLALRRLAASHGDPVVLDRLRPNTRQVAQLVERLSPQAQRVLEETRGEQDKRRLMFDWMNAAFLSRLRVSPGQEVPPQFFERLDPDQRAFLENLPPDQMQTELERIYLRSRAKRLNEGRHPRQP